MKKIYIAVDNDLISEARRPSAHYNVRRFMSAQRPNIVISEPVYVMAMAGVVSLERTDPASAERLRDYYRLLLAHSAGYLPFNRRDIEFLLRLRLMKELRGYDGYCASRNEKETLKKVAFSINRSCPIATIGPQAYRRINDVIRLPGVYDVKHLEWVVPYANDSVREMVEGPLKDATAGRPVH